MTRMKYLIFLLLESFLLTEIHQVIALDPSSPLGYERKHEALHGARHYSDAIVAFETMLSKISESSDCGECDDVLQAFTH